VRISHTELILPDLRSYVEGMCTTIARGEAEFSVVVKHMTETFAAKFTYFVAMVCH